MARMSTRRILTLLVGLGAVGAIVACGSGGSTSTDAASKGTTGVDVTGKAGASGASGASGGGPAAGGGGKAGKAGGGSGGATGGAAGAGGKAGAGGAAPKLCVTAATCDDANDCTTDACTSGACVNTPKLDKEPCAGGAKLCKAGACVAHACGDGVKAATEQCDDGNQIDTDGCTNTCKIPVCGDGVKAGAEECDDGNPIDTDGCTKQCKKPKHGDGSPFNPTGEGSTGVKLDPSGNIIIDPNGAVTKQTKPLIWVANSGEGTVSKIDTTTRQELSRYCTAPGCGGDPSRTTVGLSADVVVANRGGGSAVRIAADESSCVDRNKNGKIDTHKGAGPVPAQFNWPAGQQDSPDECVLWWTDLKMGGGSPMPRAAGWDAEIGDKGELSVFVYIGLYNTGQLLRINGATGAIVKSIPVPGNPYGLVVDKDANVWIQSGGSNGLVKVDVKAGDAVSTHPLSCAYGIAADPQGRIYTAGGGCLARFDPVTKQTEILSGVTGGGLAVDQKNHVWTGESELFRVDASGPVMKLIGRAQNGGHGAAIDNDGHPWAIPIGAGVAHKIDESTLDGSGRYVTQPASVGQGSYTYSDMTGFQLKNAASKSGIYRHTFTGCSASKWESVDLSASVPPGTTITISARVAQTQADLANQAWIKVATIPPATAPVPLNLPAGAYIQIEIAMKSTDLTVTPILSSLSVKTPTDCKQ